MALSARVVRELQQELKDLKAVRDSAAARIGALEVILKRGRIHDTEPSPGKDRDSSRPSLRASVLKTLEGSRCTAADVARRLEAEGFRVGGSTTLRERVAHEMSRLRRKGVLRRVRSGEYELARGSERSLEDSGLSATGVLALN